MSVIDDLMAYDDIKLFPELYDTSTIIERITGKADLIERQLQRLGMYPQPTNISPSTSAPKPTSVRQINTAQNLHLRVHYPVDREHLQHRPALQMHHLHIHPHSHLYTHNTHLLNPINNKFNTHLLKQILTNPLSHPFQVKNNVYQNLQMVAR